MNNNLGNENGNNSSMNTNSQMDLSLLYNTTPSQGANSISNENTNMNQPVQTNQPLSNSNEIKQTPQNNMSNDVNNNLQNIYTENNQTQTQNLNNSLDQPSTNNQDNFSKDDMELLKAFIGNNCEKIITKPFNFAGFFFNSFYMFYRKMFAYGIITYLIIFALMVFVKSNVVNLVVVIILGFVVNKIYISFAVNKITKIKQENPNKDINELKSICASKGGVSVGNIFLGLLTTLAISIIIAVVSVLIGVTSFAGSFFGELISAIKSPGNGQYNGVLVFDTSVKMQDEFSVTVPGEFQNNSSDQNYNYDITETNATGMSTCSLSFALPIGYKSAEDLIKQLYDYYSKDNNVSEVTSTNINNISWHTFSSENDFGKTYYYATDKNNKVYLLTYELLGNSESACLQYKDSIVNSIESK